MNSLVECINAVGRSFVAWSAAMLVQSSVLICILFVVDLLIRRRVRAVVRYGIWMLVLVKLVLPPSLSSPFGLGAFLPAARQITPSFSPAMPAPQQEPVSSPPVLADPSVSADSAPAAHRPARPPDAGDLSLGARPSWQGLALAIWSVVVMALVLLLAQRAMFVRGLVRQAQDADPSTRSLLAEACKKMGLKARPRIRFSPNAVSPAVCGLWRPVILVPQDLVRHLQPDQAQSVLLHELAHVRRGDLWVNLVQTLLQITYFYNPLLWLANWRIRSVREQAVDEAVLVAMRDRAAEYPETLVGVARMTLARPALGLRLIGVVESKGALRSRIRHMLGRPFPKTARLGLCGLAVLTLMGVAFLPMAASQERREGSGPLAWQRTDRYVQPDPNGFFPDDPEGGTRLDALFDAPDRNRRSDEEVLVTHFAGEVDFERWKAQRELERKRIQFGGQMPQLREQLLTGDSQARRKAFNRIAGNGLTGLTDDTFLEAMEACAKDPDPKVRKEAARVVGGRWVWNAQEQSPRAIALMRALAADEDRDVRYNAVYFGLSTIRQKDQAVIGQLVDMALKDHEPNLYGRIVWGLTGPMKADPQLFTKVLAEHLDPARSDPHRAASIYLLYREVLGEDPPRQWPLAMVREHYPEDMFALPFSANDSFKPKDADALWNAFTQRLPAGMMVTRLPDGGHDGSGNCYVGVRGREKVEVVYNLIQAAPGLRVYEAHPLLSALHLWHEELYALAAGTGGQPALQREPPGIGSEVLQGRVLDWQDRPVAGAAVVICDGSSGVPLNKETFRPISEGFPQGDPMAVAFAVTDQGGRFQAGVPAGSYRLVAQSWGGAAAIKGPLEENGEEIRLHGVAQDVRPGLDVEIRPLGTGVLVLDQDMPNDDTLLVVSTSPTRADPVLGFAGWGGAFMQGMIGGNRMPGGRTTVSGLPEGTVYLAMFAPDNAPAWAAGQARIESGKRTVLQAIPFVGSWSNARHDPPEELRPLVDRVKALSDEQKREVLAGIETRMIPGGLKAGPTGLWQISGPNLQSEISLPDGGAAQVRDVLAAFQYLQLQRAVELRQQGRDRPRTSVQPTVQLSTPEPSGSNPVQALVDAAQSGATVVIPKGTYAKPLRVAKPLTLRGESPDGCILEVTANEPALSVDCKGQGHVTVEDLTIRWQLATSDKGTERPFALHVKDTEAVLRGCRFVPLGNPQRSPVAVRIDGFSKATIAECRTEGFEYAICFGEGTQGEVLDCRISDCGHQGVINYTGSTLRVQRSIITGSKFHAVRCTGGTLHVRDNIIAHNQNSGVYLGNKDSTGTIQNNLFVGNGTAVAGFYQSEYQVTHNVILDSTYAGVGTWDTCRLTVRDNIFQGNAKALVVYAKGSKDTNTFGRNTFWKNTADVENCRRTADSVLADPLFQAPGTGDYALGPGPVMEADQGLADPKIIRTSWGKWKGQEIKGP